MTIDSRTECRYDVERDDSLCRKPERTEAPGGLLLAIAHYIELLNDDDRATIAWIDAADRTAGTA